MSEPSRPFEPYLRAIVSDNLTAETAEAGGLAPACATCQAPGGYDESTWAPAIPVTTLAVVTHGGRGHRAYWGEVEGRASAPGRNFALQPKGTPNHYMTSNAVAFAHIYLPDALIDRYALDLRRRPLSEMLRTDIVFVEDLEYEALLGRYVSRAHDRVVPPTRLELEALGALVVEGLITRFHPPERLPPVRGGLSPRRLRRAQEQLDADRLGWVGLEALADEAGLSAGHFLRAFKAATGAPPHAWAVRRQLERARTRLEGTAVSIAEIAADAGYASQQGFTTAFRRVFGVTPARYRRERRG